MLGEALLVSPVLTRRRRRNIYLPKGKWINIFDGKEYEGGRTLKRFKVPPESVPVFRLAGISTPGLEEFLANAREQIDTINRLSE